MDWSACSKVLGQSDCVQVDSVLQNVNTGQTLLTSIQPRLSLILKQGRDRHAKGNRYPDDVSQRGVPARRFNTAEVRAVNSGLLG